MKWVKFASCLALLSCMAVNARSDETATPITPANLRQFLARYEQSLEPIDAAYADLMSQPFPMRDDSGRRVGRREIKDRRKIVADLRAAVQVLAASPENLVLALTLFDHTEKLGDDLYDLSQIAYDNDLEEEATRLTELLTTLDHNQDLIEGYVFNLAAEKEKQILELRKESGEMRKRLQGMGAQNGQ